MHSQALTIMNDMKISEYGNLPLIILFSRLMPMSLKQTHYSVRRCPWTEVFGPNHVRVIGGSMHAQAFYGNLPLILLFSHLMPMSL